MKRPFQSRLELLNRAYDQWRTKTRLSHLDLAATIVEASDMIGISDGIKHHGMTWSTSDDIDRRRATNSQLIRRALGHNPEVSAGKEEVLWEIERAIVAAMPADLRIDYLSALHPGVVICKPLAGGSSTDGVTAINNVMKGGYEANTALFNYKCNPSLETSTAAIRELTESMTADAESINWVQADWDKRSKGVEA